jgi:trehalose synthase
MNPPRIVPVPRRPVASLAQVVGPDRYARLIDAAERFRTLLGDRTIWNVSSTAVGGGVAEMLQCLIGYIDDLDIPACWATVGGDAAFFAITKRVHNQIHGQGGPVAAFSAAEADHYGRTCALNAAAFVDRVRAGDFVLLHDPQTAGMARTLVEAGATVVWRCHIGLDMENDLTRAAWAFLRPHIEAAHGFVFSRQQYVPSWLRSAPTWIVPPSIDPFAPKNQNLDADTVTAILSTIGVLDSAPAAPGRFIRRDGSPGAVTRPALIVGAGRPAPDDAMVVQVSRWDRLKDMAGVMQGFAEHVAPSCAGYLLLVGPAVAGVSDDPEGAEVYAECVAQWERLPAAVRDRVLLVTLPLDDVDENAAMVNAIQRHASMIVQKSLAEGFGLTVAEGMWKGRPVIGSAVGGILDQIADGTGVLLPDPTDLAAFGAAVRGLLDDPDKADLMGQAAHRHVRSNFVGDLHMLRYADLFGSVISGGDR